jgi:DNA-binding MarR family transcriptional regulator
MTTEEKAKLIAGVLKTSGDLKGAKLRIMLELYTATETPLIHVLAKGCGFTAPAISRAIDELERSGFARRKRDEKKDRRRVHIHITAKGKNALDKILA